MADRHFYVYILASRSLNFYVGLTSHLPKRIWEHKRKAFGGFTARYNINRLVYYEVFRYINNAIDREKRLKKWSRAKKIALIKTMNPTWLDLSEGWYNNADPSPASASRGSAGAARDDNS